MKTAIRPVRLLTIPRQTREDQTKSRDEQLRCCDQWCQKPLRGHKTKTGYYLGANGINEMIVNIEKSSFSGVMFTVRRLVRAEKIVRRKVFSNSRVDNTLDDFVFVL